MKTMAKPTRFSVSLAQNLEVHQQGQRESTHKSRNSYSPPSSAKAVPQRRSSVLEGPRLYSSFLAPLANIAAVRL